MGWRPSWSTTACPVLMEVELLSSPTIATNSVRCSPRIILLLRSGGMRETSPAPDFKCFRNSYDLRWVREATDASLANWTMGLCGVLKSFAICFRNTLGFIPLFTITCAVFLTDVASGIWYLFGIMINYRTCSTINSLAIVLAEQYLCGISNVGSSAKTCAPISIALFGDAHSKLNPRK